MILNLFKQDIVISQARCDSWFFNLTTFYHHHGGNRKWTPLPPLDVLIHLLLSEIIFSPLPLRTAEISSVGGVWIFSGTTQWAMPLFQQYYSFLEYFIILDSSL